MKKMVDGCLIILAVIIFINIQGQLVWIDEFGDIDSCCSGLCGRCPPSFWECSFMMSSEVVMLLVAIGLVMISIADMILGDERNK